MAPRTAVAQNQFSIAATHSVAVRLDLLRKRRVRYCLSFVTKQQLTLSCLRLRASFGVALNVTQMWRNYWEIVLRLNLGKHFRELEKFDKSTQATGGKVWKCKNSFLLVSNAKRRQLKTNSCKLWKVQVILEGRVPQLNVTADSGEKGLLPLPELSGQLFLCEKRKTAGPNVSVSVRLSLLASSQEGLKLLEAGIGRRTSPSVFFSPLTRESRLNDASLYCGSLEQRWVRLTIHGPGLLKWHLNIKHYEKIFQT